MLLDTVLFLSVTAELVSSAIIIPTFPVFSVKSQFSIIMLPPRVLNMIPYEISDVLLVIVESLINDGVPSNLTVFSIPIIAANFASLLSKVDPLMSKFNWPLYDISSI